MSVNAKTLTTIIILVLLLVIPPIIYSYVTKGYNNFMKLEVIGEKDLDGNDHKTVSYTHLTLPTKA